MKQFNDKFLYWSMLISALIFFLSGVYLLYWNMNRLNDGYISLINQCAPTQDYLCALTSISEYNLAYSTYYHILAGILCIAAIFSSAIVTFVLQNKHSHFIDLKKD